MHFFIFLFFLYGIASLWICFRGYLLLPHIGWLRLLYAVVALGLTASVVVSMFFPSHMGFALNRLFSNVAMTWLLAVMYLGLTLLCIDLVRLVHWIVPFLPTFTPQAKYWLLGGILGFWALMFLYGHHKVTHFATTTLVQERPSDRNQGSPFKMVAISDLHLGVQSSLKQIERWVDAINAQQPDFAVIVGDLIDRDAQVVLDRKLYSPLQHIQPPVYVVKGNHDMMRRDNLFNTLIDSCHFTLLQDEMICLPGKAYLIGRQDRSVMRRKSLSDILTASCDTCDSLYQSLPLIVLDHQPSHFEEAISAQIDLQISGHTHAGQAWPFTYIVKRANDLWYGKEQHGRTTFYVTSGINLWGPSYRIGAPASEMTVVEYR